jgi:hypothetical protein
MTPFKYGMIVDGENYCPRPELARQFSKLVEAGLNVVIQGERRMGKTSFVRETIKSLRDMELVYIDLYCVKTVEEFCRRAVAAVTALERSAGFLRRTAQLLTRLRPVLTMDPETGVPQLTVEVRPDEGIASLEDVMDMISAHAAKRSLCIVFDEFQDVLELDDPDILLARLRAKIQFQNKTPHVFLGSVRNRMHEIFDSPKSPFFKSATSFSVGAIEAGDFKRFLSDRFKVSHRKISETALDRILTIADGISGDVQELCETIWLATNDGDCIGDDQIDAGLQLVFAREEKAFGPTLSRLTPTQAAVLKGLALDSNLRPFSGGFLSRNGIRNVGTVTRALTRLAKDEIIYEYASSWRFTNPFFREWLKFRQTSSTQAT